MIPTTIINACLQNKRQTVKVISQVLLHLVPLILMIKENTIKIIINQFHLLNQGVDMCMKSLMTITFQIVLYSSLISLNIYIKNYY